MFKEEEERIIIMLYSASGCEIREQMALTYYEAITNGDKHNGSGYTPECRYREKVDNIYHKVREYRNVNEYNFVNNDNFINEDFDKTAKFLKELCGLNLDDYANKRFIDLFKDIIKEGIKKL